MQCQTAQKRMWGSVELGNVEDRDILRHLESCTVCSSVWQDMLRFQHELQQFKTAQPSPEFVGKVMEKIESVEEDATASAEQHNTDPVWTTWNHAWIASAATFTVLALSEAILTGDTSSGLPAVTAYTLRFGRTVSEFAVQITHLF